MPELRYPLTALQMGMVYQSLRSPQSGLYVQQLTGRLRNPSTVRLVQGLSGHASWRATLYCARACISRTSRIFLRKLNRCAA